MSDHGDRRSPWPRRLVLLALLAGGLWFAWQQDAVRQFVTGNKERLQAPSKGPRDAALRDTFANRRAKLDELLEWAGTRNGQWIVGRDRLALFDQQLYRLGPDEWRDGDKTLSNAEALALVDLEDDEYASLRELLAAAGVLSAESFAWRGRTVYRFHAGGRRSGLLGSEKGFVYLDGAEVTSVSDTDKETAPTEGRMLFAELGDNWYVFRS